MSETGLTPRSPLLDVLNVRDISEVISEVVYEVDTEKEDEQTDTQVSGESQDLSDQIITKAEQQKSLSNVEENVFQFQKQESKSLESEKSRVYKQTEKEENPFHFNKSKIRSFEQSESEPKKSEPKNGASISNKKRNDILESQSNSLIEKEEIKKEIHMRTDIETSDSDTLKEEVEKKKPRKKWQKESHPIKIKTKPIQHDSSFEGSCYYCRNVCERHQSMIMSECQPAHEKQRSIQNIETSEVGVQAGKSTIHHYLFDPTQDAIFDPTFQPNYLRAPGLGSNAAASSIIDLMKRQLQLTEQHMRSQKELYRQYCTTLEKTQVKSKNHELNERVLYGRSERPKKLSFEDALKMVKEEMAEQEKEVEQISKSYISSKTNKKVTKSSKKRRSKSSSKEKTSTTSQTKSSNSKESHQDSHKQVKHIVSAGVSIEEEIDNDDYEMEFETESEVKTDTHISTEESSDS